MNQDKIIRAHKAMTKEWCSVFRKVDDGYYEYGENFRSTISSSIFSLGENIKSVSIGMQCFQPFKIPKGKLFTIIDQEKFSIEKLKKLHLEFTRILKLIDDGRSDD